MPKRKRPHKLTPTPPEKDVRELQDPEQTEADFLADLEKASRRIEEAKERLEDPSEPEQESPRTTE